MDFIFTEGGELLARVDLLSACLAPFPVFILPSAVKA